MPSSPAAPWDLPAQTFLPVIMMKRWFPKVVGEGGRGSWGRKKGGEREGGMRHNECFTLSPLRCACRAPGEAEGVSSGVGPCMMLWTTPLAYILRRDPVKLSLPSIIMLYMS